MIKTVHQTLIRSTMQPIKVKGKGGGIERRKQKTPFCCGCGRPRNLCCGLESENMIIKSMLNSINYLLKSNL